MRLGLLLLLALPALQAQGVLTAPTNPPSNVRPAALRNVGIDQKLNNQLPLDLHFRNENGRDVRLGEFFGKRAVILTPVYYGCPMLCSQPDPDRARQRTQAPHLQRGARNLEVIAVSFLIPPRPRSSLSRRNKNYVARYARAGSENGFHFPHR